MHQRSMKLALLAGTAFAALLGGCGKKADTPKDAAVRFAESVHEGDRAQFRAVVWTGDAEATDALFESLSAAHAFHQAFVKAYGEDAAGGYAPMPEGDEVEDDVRIEEKGLKKAFATLPGQNVKYTILLRDDSWYVDLSEQVPEEGAAQALQDARAMAEMYKRLIDRIGEDGWSADRINQALIDEAAEVAQ